MSEPSPEESLALLDEIVLGSARGGRRKAEPLLAEPVRSLTAEDLPLLRNPPPVDAAPQTILQIRHSHHMIAQSMAQGDELQHTALMTGYSTAYLSNLKNDPAFAELLAYYGKNREAVFIDVAERMKNLGISTLDELQARLADNPSDWTKREMMELAELMLIKGRAPVQAGGASGGGGVAVNIQFVASNNSQTPAIDVSPAPSRQLEFEG